jgi:hypothetical protein
VAIQPARGGGIPYKITVEKPTELEDSLLTATAALLIQNQQLKKRRIFEAATK